MAAGSSGRWWQSSGQGFAFIGVLLFRLACTLNDAAAAFSLRHYHTNNAKVGNNIVRRIRHRCSMPLARDCGKRHRLFSQQLDSSTFGITEEEGLLLSNEESDEEVNHYAPTKIITGTAGFIVTKTYHVPPEGFPEASGKDDDAVSLSAVFSPADITRLRLEPLNVTLPVALMLLDPGKYPTQSRARKAIRQRSICICRSSQRLGSPHNESPLEFDELGKVITRIYAGDVVGHQRRAGSDYYALQGAPYRPPPFEVPVVYEDDSMAIVNKPAGVVMYRYRAESPDGPRGGRPGHGRDTLLSALPYVLKPCSFSGSNDGDDGAQDGTAMRRPQPVHRLDRPVSGLVVVAKTKAATRHLSQQFEFRRARKTYMAVVNGRPRQSTASQENEPPLPSEWSTIGYDLDGKSAITEWRAIRSAKSLHGKDGQLTLVELKPKTGRYHQLRRHMAWVCNSPLVGDTTYDGADDSALRLRKRGLLLCSNEIELEHPYYNTPAGRKKWDAMGGIEMRRGNAVVWEDEGTDTVMVKARIELPQKFESFLEHENARAEKFVE